MDDVIGTAECVLFDFDGPMCRLFAGHPASGIAQRLRELIGDHGPPEALTPAVLGTGDPLVVLRAMEPGGRLAGVLERALTAEETRAAVSAMPTAYADQLVRTLVATGRRVAVTTNNAQPAVERYLTSRGLAHHFDGHVHGRLHDVGLLKPHPDCLLRALSSTGTPPERAVMIGDTVPDLRAAQRAGVAFVGYTPGGKRLADLRRAGAAHTVASLSTILSVVNTPSFG